MFTTKFVEKAQEKGLFSFSTYNLLDYAEPGKRIDTPTMGHRSGMVLRADYTEQAVQACTTKLMESI